MLKALRPSPSLSQIGLDDGGWLENSYLYKLSGAIGLEWFTHVVFLSSPQDLYVPGYSARVDVPQGLKSKEPLGKVCEMAKQLLGRLQRVCRMSVDFRIEERTLDSFIGRASHIQFLENQLFMKMLVYTKPEFFC